MGVLIRKGIPYGGSTPQVQSDWDETSVSSAAYILNKPTALSDFTNDLNFITKTVNDLTNYYTKTQVDEFIDLIPKFKIKVVPSLLVVTDPNETTVYLVPSSDPESSNIYTEYVYVIDETTHTGEFEKIGVQDVDLTDYVRKSELPGLIKNDGTIDPNKYFPDKDALYRNAPKTWYGMPIFNGNGIWHDGDTLYYSDDEVQKVFDRDTHTWKNKEWNGIGIKSYDESPDLVGNGVWTDGENIYYSRIDSWDNQQKVLDRSTNTWSDIEWNDGEVDIYSASCIWSNGIDVFYSDGTTQMVLNKSTKIWEDKTWNSLPEDGFSGANVWTDGTNYYISEGTIQKIIDFSTNTLSNKTWGEGGPSQMNGSDIWRDGEHIYYSYGTGQYELNRSNDTWETKTWYDGATGEEVDGFYTTYLWFDGDDVYFSYVRIADEYEFEGHKKLNQATSTWEDVTWEDMTDFDAENVWSDGDSIRCSHNGRECILNPLTSTWECLPWDPSRINEGKYVWTDGTNIYYSDNYTQLVLDKETKEWHDKTWSGLSRFSAENIWTDGDNIYCSDGYSNNQKVLDISTSTWSNKTWNEFSSIDGKDIWTDGTNYYYSNQYIQKVLNKATSTWSDITWNGTDDFILDGEYIWNFNGVTYFSGVDGVHKILDKTTNTWYDKDWEGFTDFLGKDIWCDGDHLYCSKRNLQYEFSSSNGSSASQGLVKVDGKTIWIDKDGTLHINIASTSTLGLVKPDGTTITADPDGTIHAYIDTEKYIEKSSTSGFIKNDGSIDENTYIPKREDFYTNIWEYLLEEEQYIESPYVWSDGDDLYYSDDSRQFKFNKTTLMWEEKTWSNYSPSLGSYVWSDGTNTYYSNEYVFNKVTKEWEDKTWDYAPSDLGRDTVWSDGENIYYSCGDSQYVLDAVNNTWVEKIWNYEELEEGYLPSPYGNQVWTDGKSIYCSDDNENGMVLDKATNTWMHKTWNIIPDGQYVWYAGDHVFYSNSTTQYELDKNTDTWVPKTWDGLTDFYGTNICVCDNNYYTYHDREEGGSTQYNCLFTLKKDSPLLLRSDGTEDPNTYAQTSDIPDISGKADKVINATSDNFAKLDANGNLADSGYSANSFMRNIYLEQTVTLSTSAATTVTFSDSSITTTSVIDLAVSEWGLTPDDVTVIEGVCTVTMPKVDSAHSVTVRIYVR